MHVTIGLSGNFDYIVHIVNCALFPIFAALWKKKKQHRTLYGRRIFVTSFVSPQLTMGNILYIKELRLLMP